MYTYVLVFLNVYAVFRRTKYTELEAERNRTHDMRRQKEQMAKELAELRSKFGKCLSEAELGGASMQNLTLNETIMLDHANETIEEVSIFGHHRC